MSKLNYTKGPWKKDGLGVNGHDNKPVIMTYGPGFGSKTGWPEAEGNSKIVMQSPEMYEALKEITKAKVNWTLENVAIELPVEILSKIVEIVNAIEG